MPVIGPAKQTQPSYASGYAKSASESANPNLWNGLVGAWMPMMGQGGYNLQDLSGHGNHVTAYGRSTPPKLSIVDGVRVVSLDESADYYKADNVKDFSPEFLTYCYYVTDPVSAGYEVPGGVWRSGKRSWLSRHQNGYPTFFVSPDGGTSSNVVSSVPLQSNKATFVAMRYDGKTIKIFQDGIETASLNYSSGVFNSQTEFSMGDMLFVNSTTPYGWNWSGGIASQMVYNRALSHAEINQLYVDPVAPFRQRRRVIASTQVAPAFNNWYARPGRKHRIIGSGVHV